jgi:membrane-bound metal-dependent hydrolase YbcI (DUF457 family)
VKGFSHFISGVAAASFLPGVVEMSAQGSFVLLIAGLGGIIPDTLDFRLARFLDTPAVEIDPDPEALDPQAMAEEVALAIDRAYATGKPVIAQLHTIRLGADLWRKYSIRFSSEERTVSVRIGPLTSLSRVPYPGSEPDLPLGCARTSAALRITEDPSTQVDVLSGPSFEFRRCGDAVEVTFLPWHRRWSHSFALAALLGGLFALALGPVHGAAYALGSTVHILEDQLGHMGSSLFHPFSRRRIVGVGLFHAGDVLPNLFAVWASAVLVLVNMARFSKSPLLDPWRVLLTALIVPWVAISIASWWRRRRHARDNGSATEDRLAEVAAEAEESPA